MVVDRNRQDFLGQLLTDHILVQDRFDFLRRGQLVGLGFTRRLFDLLADDVIAQVNAFIANEHRRPGDQLAHLVLAFPTE